MSANRNLRAILRVLGGPVLFVVMAAAVLGPTLLQLNTTLPTGPTKVATVPLFNVWTIWWNIDRSSHGFAEYWDAPVFHPADGAFAFSEPQPATLMVTPVYWSTGSLIVAYKTYLLLSLVLNGVFAARLCRHLRVGRTWAVAAGAMMVWLPLGVRQLDVLQLIPVWGILWTWDAAWRHCHRPTYRSGGVAAFACASSFYMSIHHGLFMMIVLIPALLLTIPWRRAVVAWKPNAVAIVLSAVLVGTLALPMRSIMRSHKFERSKQLVTSLSAHANQLLRLPNEALIGKRSEAKGFRLSPGWLKMAMACVGVTLGVCRRRKRRWVLFVLMTVLLSATLALGPNLKVGSWQPWWSIAQIVPGLRQTRNVFRFFYLAQMGIILLATVGLSECWLRLRHRLQKPRRALALMGLLSVLCVIELPPPSPLLAGVPNRERHRQWADFVKQQTPEGASIACLPFPPGGRVADFDITARWMYYGTLHGVPMINGYSGFFPPQYFSLQRSFNKSGLSDAVLSQFLQADVYLVVVHTKYLSPEAIAKLDLQRHRLEHVFADDSGVDVYRLTRTQLSAVDGNSPAEFVASPKGWRLSEIADRVCQDQSSGGDELYSGATLPIE